MSIYPSVSDSQNEQKSLIKLQSENLFNKLEQIEKELKHYNKLKHKWNIFKNVLHYSKYPLALILGGLDVALIFTGIGIPLAIIGAGVTIGEVVGTNVFEDAIVNVKIDKYNKKCKHIKEWIDKMYIFKIEELKDNVIDVKEIQQWKQLLIEYEQSLTNIQSSKNEKKIDLKKIQDQINTLIQQKNRA